MTCGPTCSYSFWVAFSILQQALRKRWFSFFAISSMQAAGIHYISDFLPCFSNNRVVWLLMCAGTCLVLCAACTVFIQTHLWRCRGNYCVKHAVSIHKPSLCAAASALPSSSASSAGTTFAISRDVIPSR